MKKQSYKMNHNSSSADNQVRRQTPPFVEFQTVRQFFRISLPDDIGMRDMEPINAKISKAADTSKDREFIGGDMKVRSGKNKEKKSREFRGKSIGKEEEKCTGNNSKDKRNSVGKVSDIMGLGKKKNYAQQLQNLLQRQVLYEKQDTQFTEKYVQRREKEKDGNDKKQKSKSKNKQKQQQEQGTRKQKQKQTERSKEKGRSSKQRVAQTKKGKQKASQEWLQNKVRAHRENQQKSKTIQIKSNNIQININNWNNGSNHNRSSGFNNNNNKYEEFINFNFSQNLQPSRNQDIRKVYQIHSQRLKNNQSYNVNRREGKIGHRRGCSEHIWDGSKDVKKGKSIDKVSIINQKQHKIDNLINYICDNSFDQLSIYRLHTKDADESKQKMTANNINNNSKQEKASKLSNKNVLQQLYNSSSSLHANKNRNKQHQKSSDSIDSQDQYLLTKISHDISKLDQGRRKSGQKGTQVNVGVDVKVTENRRSKELEVFDDGGEAVDWGQQRQDSEKIQMKNVKSQQILIPCPQIPNLDTQHPNLHNRVPKDVEIEESLQQKVHTKNLLQKIDMVLQQIKCREKRQEPQISQIAKIEFKCKQPQRLIQVENEQIEKGNRNQTQSNGSNQYDSNNNRSANHEFSNNISGVWDQQPTIMELELILDQCLDDKPNFQMQMGRVIGMGSQQNVNKPNQQPLVDSHVGKYSNLESKWKQSKQKTIKKAQKLLKQGIFLATKILKSRIPQTSTLPISRLSKKRQKYQSHSMQNLKSIKTISSIPHPSFSIPQKASTEKSKIIQEFNELIDDGDSFQVKSGSLIDQVYVKDVNQQKQGKGKDDRETRIWKVAEAQNKEMQDLEKALATNKLKLNCDEIIQIVMLDLCIEIIEDVEVYFNKPGNIFQKLYLMLSKLKSKRRLGFSTSPTETYSHLQKLSKFLQKTIDKDCQKSYIKLIQERISEPIGPKPIQLLKFMREPTDFPFVSAQDDEVDDDQKQEKQTFALSLSWFHQFSQAYIKQYDFGKYYLEDEERENKRVAFLKNAMHVHNKAIFDCVNELIDKHRPYGLIGQPFPWKPNLPPPKITPKYFSNILNSTFEQVSQNTRFLCGIFAEQHLTYKLTKLQFLEFSQDRLNRMLCKHVHDVIMQIEENQIRWAFVDDEETEVLVEVARGVIRQLVEEAVRDILGCGA